MDLASVKKKISVEATRFRSSVSEFLIQTLGKSMNYLIDQNDAIEAALAANYFSDIQSVDVTANNYTVPVGYTFYGTLMSKAANTGGVHVTITYGGVDYQVAAVPSGTGHQMALVPIVAAAGAIAFTASATSGATTEYIRGVIFKSAPIII